MHSFLVGITNLQLLRVVVAVFHPHLLFSRQGIFPKKCQNDNYLSTIYRGAYLLGSLGVEVGELLFPFVLFRTINIADV